MLIEFTVGNFRSFDEPVTLNMAAIKKLTEKPENMFEVEKNLSLLKTTAIYGANASGKSNLIKAFLFFGSLVDNSSKEGQQGKAIEAEPFLLKSKNKKKPSFFEIVLLINETRYRYGFEATEKRIISEWLYYVPNKREARLFERKMDEYKINKNFKEGKGLESKTRKNALFLSTVAQFNGDISGKFIEAMDKITLVNGHEFSRLTQHTSDLISKNVYKDKIIKFIRNLDLGIYDIKVNKISFTDADFFANTSKKTIKMFKEANTYQNLILHKVDGDPKKLIEMDLEQHESDGTQKLFAFAGIIIETLERGMVLIVDELDSRLHPSLTVEIIKMFNSEKTNPKNAQLIFTTHDTSLLNKRNELFRRDQIWFTEKKKDASTDLYSLAEFNNPRKEDQIELGYVTGKYGAIPFVGDLESLFDGDE